MTPRLATNQNKQITWRWEGEAFGETNAKQDPDGDGNPTTINLRFPGQYYDKETGLHYNWFRDYNPQTGRYRQSDLIGLQGGLNTYGYAYQNSLMYYDPDGHVPTIFIRLVLAADDAIRLSAEANAKYTDGEDNLKHIEVSRELTRRHGPDVAFIYGAAKEIRDLVDGKQNSSPSWKDMGSNLKGIGEGLGLRREDLPKKLNDGAFDGPDSNFSPYPDLVPQSPIPGSELDPNPDPGKSCK